MTGFFINVFAMSHDIMERAFLFLLLFGVILPVGLDNCYFTCVVMVPCQRHGIAVIPNWISLHPWGLRHLGTSSTSPV